MNVGVILDYWAAHGWEIIHKAERPGCAEQLFPSSNLPLSVPAQRYLKYRYPQGLYRRQIEALRLLPNIGDSTIWRFIQRLRLLIADEVHSYTGVFGSNTAFLFRRLEHVMDLAGSQASYITASATMRDPSEHLRALFERGFSLVDNFHDTSGRHELTIYMVQPKGKDVLGSVSSFIEQVAKNSSARFICFVDSRKQAELVATIVARSHRSAAAEVDGDPHVTYDQLQTYDVLPYRAGLEQRDRAVIQDRLSSGSLRGVISTSALELGIDVPHLDLGILVGLLVLRQ